MSLHPTARAREKILLAGPWGSGKSHARNRLIAALKASGSDAKVYVLDTDDTHDRAIDAYGDDFMTNVEWRYVNIWEDWLDAAKDFSTKITKDDWLVVDRGDLSWSSAQDYYTRRVYGVDSAEFYLQFAEANANNARTPGSPFAGAHGQQWDHIKRTYAQFVAYALMPRTTMRNGDTYGHPGHVMLCANVKDVNVEQDERETIQTYQRFGVKPAGEKNLPALFHSVLMMGAGPDWTLTTAREREGRQYVNGLRVGDFVLDYLVGVGGWSFDGG